MRELVSIHLARTHDVDLESDDEAEPMAQGGGGGGGGGDGGGGGADEGTMVQLVEFDGVAPYVYSNLNGLVEREEGGGGLVVHALVAPERIEAPPS